MRSSFRFLIAACLRDLVCLFIEFEQNIADPFVAEVEEALVVK